MLANGPGLPAAQVNVTAFLPTPVITGPHVVHGWTAAAPEYFYGTLEVPVATAEHDWVFVSVSWEAGEDNGIAFCADNVHNVYQPVTISPPGSKAMTQVFLVPNARAASTVYVSTSAYVRWLTVLVLDVAGLQAGYTVDASQPYAGGPATTFTETLTTAQPDFVLAMGAFQGSPQTVTQAGSGAPWIALPWAGINGSGTDGITQSGAWAVTSGAASPSMQFTAASGFYSGSMIAVYTQGGLPANANPAWPVTKCQAAFGYTPQEPTVPPVWTDITPRYLGLSGERGRSFELDTLSAADIDLHLDNFDGALSPQNAASPYYPNVTLITPVQVIKTWQGRTSVVFRGLMTALPQTYDFQRGVVKVAATDDYSKLAQTLLPTCMIQEMLFDKPVSLWPLNEQQTATFASNWSGRSAAVLKPVPAQFASAIAGAGTGGSTPPVVPSVFFVGKTFPVFGLSAAILGQNPASVTAQSAESGASPPTPPAVPTTGFGNSNSGIFPGGLAGTTDSVWGNTGGLTTANYYQGTVLTDSNDSTLPLTATGATYSVWAQMYYVPANTNATLMVLTDQAGTPGSKNYLTLTYNGTQVTVTQTAGSTSFTPSAFLFDSKFHLWTVTVSTTGTITVYLDGNVLGTRAGSFPAGTPTLLQWGGDTTATTATAAGMFTGCQSTAGVYDRVVDPERIQAWFQSGSSGFLNETAGVRIQRILTWARWSAPQAADPGLSMQQAMNYLTGGYGTNGLTGAIGNFATAGGSIGINQGAQADVTIQDVANTENGLLFITADGTLGFRQRGSTSAPAALPLGDTDYALNTWQAFEGGLGPWTSTVSCTVAQSSGWSYAGRHSALVTVTGTPVTAYAWGDKASVQPNQAAGFSCWVMSPQACTVRADVDWYTPGNVFISTSSGGSVSVPPMTPVFLNLTGLTAPGTAGFGYPHPTLISSPATGTQLYFDRPRLSPSGFQCPYMDDVSVTEDIQYLFNDIAITRNVDQASYRARDVTSRSRFYPRIYTRTIFSSVDDVNAVPNCANTLLSAFAYPALRVSRVVVNAAEQPEAWPFVLTTEIGDTVSFTRTPVGGAAVTGSFTVLSIEPDLAPDRAQFTYTLIPAGVF